jgi:hypothetical protein
MGKISVGGAPRPSSDPVPNLFGECGQRLYRTDHDLESIIPCSPHFMRYMPLSGQLPILAANFGPGAIEWVHDDG